MDMGFQFPVLKGVFGQLHFQPALQEGEGGLGALIGVRPIGVQAVAAAAGDGIIDRLMEVVAAVEPFKGAPGLLAPAAVAGGLMGGQAGRDHGLRLHRLLIKARALAAARIEAV